MAGNEGFVEFHGEIEIGVNVNLDEDDEILEDIPQQEVTLQRKKRCGMVLRRKMRERVVELTKQLQDNAKESGVYCSKNQISEEVCKTLGIGRSTHFRILKESEEASKRGKKLSTPGKRRPVAQKLCESMDGLMQDTLRKHIHDMYTRSEHPTLNKLLVFSQNDLKFSGKRTTLWRALRKMGFRYKVYNGRQYLLEKHNVRLLRAEYLQKWKTLHEQEKTFIYLAVTWVSQNPSPSNLSTGFQQKHSNGKGKRVVMLHAGCSNGFIPNCLLLFESNGGQFDYRKDINEEVFMEWFQEKLLPNIPPNSAIVMDNGLYYSMACEKMPTSGWRKDDILNWLHCNGVTEANSSMLKVKLYDLAKRHIPQAKTCVIDTLAANAGHVVLRLPPHHFQFNPIELVWTNVKSLIVQKYIASFQVDDVMELAKNSVNEVPLELWADCIAHSNRQCWEYYARDYVIESRVEEMITRSGGDEDETTEEDESDLE